MLIDLGILSMSTDSLGERVVSLNLSRVNIYGSVGAVQPGLVKAAESKRPLQKQSKLEIAKALMANGWEPTLLGPAPLKPDGPWQFLVRQKVLCIPT